MDDERGHAEAQAQGKVSEILQALSQEIHHEKAGLEGRSVGMLLVEVLHRSRAENNEEAHP